MKLRCVLYLVEGNFLQSFKMVTKETDKWSIIHGSGQPELDRRATCFNRLLCLNALMRPAYLLNVRKQTVDSPMKLAKSKVVLELARFIGFYKSRLRHEVVGDRSDILIK